MSVVKSMSRMSTDAARAVMLRLRLRLLVVVVVVGA